MIRQYLFTLASVNTTLAIFGNTAPIAQIVNQKLVIDITNLFITGVMGAVTTIGIAWVKAKYQKRSKKDDL
ncbi:hypothetical protein [Pedobacter nototheniae]|uniref:hypothetical protein n=1 Tax=Pedobacter nototheniae TaxID=2488994 RepID=UPI00103B8650|nr:MULTISPECIES: hypothetical protein [Pedobacter]